MLSDVVSVLDLRYEVSGDRNGEYVDEIHQPREMRDEISLRKCIGQGDSPSMVLLAGGILWKHLEALTTLPSSGQASIPRILQSSNVK